MYGLFQTSFYFGYMAVFSTALGIMCGELMCTSLFSQRKAFVFTFYLAFVCRQMWNCMCIGVTVFGVLTVKWNISPSHPQGPLDIWEQVPLWGKSTQMLRLTSSVSDIWTWKIQGFSRGRQHLFKKKSDCGILPCIDLHFLDNLQLNDRSAQRIGRQCLINYFLISSFESPFSCNITKFLWFISKSFNIFPSSFWQMPHPPTVNIVLLME